MLAERSKAPWYVPEPQVRGLIITIGRTGSHFLMRCLSNHPHVHCPRYEPFGASTPRHVLGHNLPWQQRLALEWRQIGYQAAVLKIDQKLITSHILGHARRVYDARAIHLVRRNVLRIEVSHQQYALGTRGRLNGYQTHANRRLPPMRFALDVPRVVGRCRHLEALQRRGREIAERAGLPVLDIEYADMVGGEGQDASAMAGPVARKLCAFLEVPYFPMTTELRRTGQRDLAHTVINYDELVAALRGTEYECLLSSS